jgi:glutathione S-transferase
MKLYYSPGACSLASHIALLEAGLDFELERVDLRSKLTETGQDFLDINAKGYVPALVLDSGDVVTESAAVLDWIAGEAPRLGVNGVLGRTQVLQALVYMSTEIHKSFRPFFTGAGEQERTAAAQYIHRRLQWLADRKTGRYLFGNEPTVADFYLFVMLRWAVKLGIPLPDGLVTLMARMSERPKVRSAIDVEELPVQRTGTV